MQRIRVIGVGAMLLFAVLAASALIHAAPARRTLLGTVRDGARPVAGIMVIVRDHPSRVRMATRTDARGRWRLATTLAGPFDIEATHLGERLASRENIAAPMSQNTIDLMLRTSPDAVALRPSSWWLAHLPESDEKRTFILDCTGCHQFNETRVMKNGAPRTEAVWRDDVTRMLGYAGAHTAFPVIGAERDADATADWLVTWLGVTAAERSALADRARNAEGADVRDASGERPAFQPLDRALAKPTAAAQRAVITEFDMPEPRDLPHDLAVDAQGHVLVTGMFTDAIHRLDPATGAFDSVPIPEPRANPRAIELDAQGRWCVLLGQPRKLARFDPDSGAWSIWDIGLYPHSVALEPKGGGVWYNGHFTKDPELIGRLDPLSGRTATIDVPPHPTLATQGGPVPYEARFSASGVFWMSELQGNRMMSYDPARGAFRTYDLPTPWSGPRRFDVAPDGIVWIPAYAGNALVRLSAAGGHMREIPLPVADALPYVARVHPRTGHVWIGTAAADAVLRFDPVGETFDVFPLPTRGVTIRHMAFDPRTGDVWLAYGASPALHPARIARLQLRP